MDNKKSKFAVEGVDELFQQALEGMERLSKKEERTTNSHSTDEEVSASESTDDVVVMEPEVISMDADEELVFPESSKSFPASDNPGESFGANPTSTSSEPLPHAAVEEAQAQLKETLAQLEEANQTIQSMEERFVQLETSLRQTEQARQDAEKEKQQHYDRLLRLSADFDNLRKRTAREREEMKRYGHEAVMGDLLTVIDNFDRAMDSIEEADQSVREGIEMVYRQFLEILKRHGVSRFASKDKPFDYTLHEAISVMESADVEPNTVIEDFQAGYMFHDRLLRPARVVVSKAPKLTEARPESEAPANASTEDSATPQSAAETSGAEASGEDAAAHSEGAGERESSPTSPEHQAAADLAADMMVEVDESPSSEAMPASSPSTPDPEAK